MRKHIFLVGLFLCNVLLLVGNNQEMSIGVKDSLQHSLETLQNIEKQNAIKELADKAYTEGDYKEALRLYEIIQEDGMESASLYYNIGNCYYKDGQLARAILNYERAFLLNPSDKDIQFNLDLAKSKTVDKITPMREVFFITWAKDLAGLLSSDAWAVCAVIMFLLLILGISVYLYSKVMILRKVGFFIAICSFLLCIASNICSFSQKEILEKHDYAIVLDASVVVKSTPDNSGTELFVLHEGHKVKIKDSQMKEWKEIQLEDGNVGWIPASSIELI